MTLNISVGQRLKRDANNLAPAKYRSRPEIKAYQDQYHAKYRSRSEVKSRRAEMYKTRDRQIFRVGVIGMTHRPVLKYTACKVRSMVGEFIAELKHLQDTRSGLARF